LKIGTNIPASIAAQSLAKNERAMAQSMQRLSTGLRINSAADDAAGLAIASRMTSQARGLDQAVQNANDAIGMIQTADGAVASVTAMLQRMRELSVQAVSDTNTTKDRSSLDLEYQALKAEIERVFNNTQWDGENLLDGSHFGSTTSFQMGANASQTIDVSLGNLSINRLGGTSTQTGYVTHASVAPTLTQTTTPVSSETLNASGTWTQRGSDIDGESAGDRSGHSVRLSDDGNTLAIGSYHASGGGQVKIYTWNGSNWLQRGADIDNVSGYEGWSVSISDDGDTVAVASPSYQNKGRVTVYDWDGSSWAKRGDDIDGVSNQHLGSDVSISENGNTIAIGARGTYGNNNGLAKIYDWNGTSWDQRGLNIPGESISDYFGNSVSLSSDGNIVAIGAPYEDSNGADSGLVRIYAWNGSAWIQRGTDIDGEGSNNYSGHSVSLSDNGNTLAIGSPWISAGANSTGQLRVYDWIGSSWVQRGSDLDGDTDGQRFFGGAVSLSGDGNSLIIGSGYPSNLQTGRAKIFDWNGSAWVQRGNNINGEASSDISGLGVDMSGDKSTIAVGAPRNDGANGVDSGHVRVYDWPTITNYTNGVSKLDFNNLNLVTGDRITINVAGSTQVQGIVAADGLHALLTTMASQIATKTGLYGGASASSGVINITGLADGNSVSGLSVTLEKDAENYSDSVSPTEITSAVSATASLAVIERAMTQINDQRGAYGAAMNRLEYAIDNLTTMSTNATASLSRIQDADYAKETTELARTQIIKQAATAMLAQANQQSKVVMDILNWDK
jgi:flagellin-like hook-associated protein FlgL